MYLDLLNKDKIEVNDKESDDESIEDILRKKEYEHSQIKNHTSDTVQRQRLEEEIKFLQKLIENGETKLY